MGIYKLRKVLCVLAVIVMAGCATTGGGGGVERDVGERAQARWDLLLADELDEAYAYFTPGYRSSVSRRDWERKLLLQQVRWTGAQVERVECESEDVCTTVVSIDYVVRGTLPGVKEFQSDSMARENWIRTGGEWFYLPNK